ncbi:MAG: type II toxin-antitoxin system HicA family toxin [Lachnospiraceae bacterium]|nr:type II toxin-antitoxin system HicA family toxin [Lachnospiraceae bacterium]
MNNKQIKTIKEIYTNPVKSDISWNEVESLFQSLGANISEGNGSRIRVELNGERAVFHRPHPQNNIDKGAVVSVRKFLNNAGIGL